MRTLITAALIAVFAAGFMAFVLFSSLVGYAQDAEALVGTARAARSREAAIDVAVAVFERELGAERARVPVSKEGLRLLAERVVTQGWFDQALRTTHAALLGAVSAASQTAFLDLRATKAKLRRDAAELAYRAEKECAALFDPAVCADQARAQRLISRYRARALAAIESIPDQVDLFAEVTEEDARNLRLVRRRIADLKTLRWVGLAVLASCLVLIAILNSRPIFRLLVTLGLTLVISAGLYLAALGVLRGISRHMFEVEIVAGGRGGDQVEVLAREGIRRFALQGLQDASRSSTTMVALLGMTGFGLFLGGAALNRQG